MAETKDCREGEGMEVMRCQRGKEGSDSVGQGFANGPNLACHFVCVCVAQALIMVFAFLAC